ncbi:MAG: rhodanese-like domain-containing protein [Opitutaceae bacterium]
MNWTIFAVIVVVFLALQVTRALGSLKEEDALKYLDAGAVVIDVRTPAEFANKSIPGVINIPLDQLADRIAEVVPEKEQIVLLHCRSGNRSGHGTKVLKSMGYESTYNLGSFGHAARIMESRPVPAN